LTRAFYQRENVVQVSKDLLGKVLVKKNEGQITSGLITEVEAYQGPEDKASHAYDNRRTGRTETMFGEGGRAYVYLCYGIHRMFNVVSGGIDVPHAILIRAIEPLDGVESMIERRKIKKVGYHLTSGPGNVGKALGIGLENDGLDLTKGNDISIEDRGFKLSSKNIIASPRIGIDYAEDWVSKPWRFHIKGNPWESRPNG